MTKCVDGLMVLLALQTLHTTSYIDEGEASIIANREDVSETGSGSENRFLFTFSLARSAFLR